MGFPLTFVVTFERFHRALLSLATPGDVKPPMMPGAKRRRVSSSAETCQDLLPDPQFSPDLVVSVHGSTAVTMTEYDEPMSFVLKPGDIQNSANAALSRIGDNVVCPPEILHHLKKSARIT